jgi:hypothetical protein
MTYFSGATYEAVHDRDRLAAQLERVRRLMQDGEWRTLFEIEAATGDPVQSISARLRDLRKERFGSHTVNRRRRGPERYGLFEYRLVINRPKQEESPDVNKIRTLPDFAGLCRTSGPE